MVVGADDRGWRALRLKRFVQRAAALSRGVGESLPPGRHCVADAPPSAGRPRNAPLGLPKNANTGRAYSGINILILWGAVIQYGLPG